MTRGIIAGTHIRWRSVCMLALLAAVAVVAAASTADSAAAATQTKISSDRRPYHSVNASPSSSAEVPTLTNDVGRSFGSAEGQLPLGIGLLAVGLLGLVYGLAATLSTRPMRPVGAVLTSGARRSAFSNWAQPSRATADRRAATTTDDFGSGG